MSEHQRNGKAFAQDVLGFFFCGIGAFSAVSIVLFLSGQESKEGLVEIVTTPVLRLVSLLGAPSALLFSLGLAGLGVVLFLRTRAYDALRPLLSLAGVALGVAFLLGALDHGGEAGAWIPGLVAGFAGKVLGVVLGLALAWLGWMSLPAPRAAEAHSVDAMQRIGLSARQDAAGVSSAEAALLGSETGGSPTRALPRRPASAPEEGIRPFTPPATSRPAPAPDPRGAGSAPAPVRKGEGEERVVGSPQSALREAPLFTPPPLTPAWEEPAEDPSQLDAPVPHVSSSDALEARTANEALDLETGPPLEIPGSPREENDQREEEDEEHAGLGTPASSAGLEEELEQEFDLEEPVAEEGEEILDEEEEPFAGLDPEAGPARASWEQVGLFDEGDGEDGLPERPAESTDESSEAMAEEVEESLEEIQPARSSKVETPTFDFGVEEPRRTLHEPEPVAQADDPFAGSPGEPPAATEARDFVLRPAPATMPKPASRPTAAKPKAAPKPEPVVARDEEGERWNQLVFEAGCAILEQKRVAVSMLERSFGIDFDQACRVLDELQAAGLIGPYMGGRTRDILLTREEWLSHAPHAS